MLTNASSKIGCSSPVNSFCSPAARIFVILSFLSGLKQKRDGANDGEIDTEGTPLITATLDKPVLGTNPTAKAATPTAQATTPAATPTERLNAGAAVVANADAAIASCSDIVATDVAACFEASRAIWFRASFNLCKQTLECRRAMHESCNKYHLLGGLG